MADIRDIPAWLGSAHAWKAVLASGVAVLTAATATVALHAPDPASADTFVSVAREAQVYLPDGTNHPAVEGERLPRGAELHTGATGGAQLTTAGRTVYVGATSTLTVLDGVRQDLEQGLVMVDARRGARLELATTAGTVRAAQGSLVRVEETALERVAVYAGSVTLQAVGRSATTRVDALHQVMVQPGSLPQRPTALVLRSDRWDESLAAGLVSADRELNALSSGLQQAAGASYLTVAPASLRSTTTPAAGAARGEEALSIAVATASTRYSPAEALTQVRSLRADNGSWGVVAAIVRSGVDSVSSLISAALGPTPDSDGGTVVNAGPQPGTPGGVPTTAPSPGPRPTGSPGPRPTTGPTPTVSPSTSPGLVTSLVNTVVGLLPLPTPKAPTAPVVPAPSPSSSSLLGGLLPK